MSFQADFVFQHQSRPVKLVSFSVAWEATVDFMDGLKPPRSSVYSADFPWARYLEHLRVAWNHSHSTPRPFQLQKRIPAELEPALLLPYNNADALQLLQALVAAKYLS